MIIVPSTLLNEFVLLVVWALDSCVFLLSINLLGKAMGRGEAIGSTWCTRVGHAPGRFHRWLAHRTSRTVPPWLSCLILVLAIFVVRSLLIGFLPVRATTTAGS